MSFLQDWVGVSIASSAALNKGVPLLMIPSGAVPQIFYTFQDGRATSAILSIAFSFSRFRHRGHRFRRAERPAAASVDRDAPRLSSRQINTRPSPKKRTGRGGCPRPTPEGCARRGKSASKSWQPVTKKSGPARRPRGIRMRIPDSRYGNPAALLVCSRPRLGGSGMPPFR